MYQVNHLNFNRQIEPFKTEENILINENNENIVFIEIEKLKQGDIFGMQDIIFTVDKNLDQLTLVSDGSGCILINKKSFMRFLSDESREMLKNHLTSYPSNDHLTTLYFDSINWKCFKKSNFSRTFIK